MLTLPSNRTCLDSLKSTTCPACGGKKTPMQTLCRREYFKLPRPMRQALYARIGDGYAESLLEALNYLSIEFLTLPQKEEQRPPSASNGQ